MGSNLPANSCLSLARSANLGGPCGTRHMHPHILASVATVVAVLVTLNLIGLTIAAYFLLRRK